MNREAWLQEAVSELTPLIGEWVGWTQAPAVRVSVGFPSAGGLSRKRRKVGQCWSPESSKDKVPHVFISPVLSDGISVLGTLLHELIHAGVGVKYKHGKHFKTVAQAVGLVGKMTATEVGPELAPKLEAMLERLGAYPHAALDPAQNPVKKQTTRMLKASCKQAECGYTIRLAKKWADVGLPWCPACDWAEGVPGYPLVLEEPDEKEGE